MPFGDARRLAAAAALLLVAAVLSGCVETTQQKNERAQLRTARLLASRSAVSVTRTDPDVTVLEVRTLHARAGTAIAVTLRNTRAKPLSDLPISVGVAGHGGHTRLLNDRPELPYFQTHVAAIGGGAAATWVFTTPSTKARGTAFARVGPPAVAFPRHVARVPAIASSLTGVRRGRNRSVASVRLTNDSAASQHGLQVYAYALSGQRLVAAGTAPLASLGSGATKTLRIPLLGDPGKSTVQVQIPPTNRR